MRAGAEPEGLAVAIDDDHAILTAILAVGTVSSPR
jgi:hypothetical protein